MINSIIEGIARAIAEEFGDDYTIYAESVKQGLSEPCFFISCLSPTDRRLLSNCNSHYLASRYYRENRFCIQYLPSDENNGRTESYDAADRLFYCLQEIMADGDLMRGTKTSFEYVDGVLSFFINYNCFVYMTREPAEMEKMTYQGGVKHN